MLRKLRSPDTAPLFVHQNLWGYVEVAVYRRWRETEMRYNREILFTDYRGR